MGRWVYPWWRNDGTLTLYGPDRKKIASVDDTWLSGEDPILSLIAKVDGPHYIKVHQSMEHEHGARSYAIHIGTGIRPLMVYPLGGEAGKELALNYIGEFESEQTTGSTAPTSRDL